MEFVGSYPSQETFELIQNIFETATFKIYLIPFKCSANFLTHLSNVTLPLRFDTIHHTIQHWSEFQKEKQKEICLQSIQICGRDQSKLFHRRKKICRIGSLRKRGPDFSKSGCKNGRHPPQMIPNLLNKVSEGEYTVNSTMFNRWRVV